MSVRIKKGTALQALNLTPLIDVVFLLLIFFLVTSRFEQEDEKINNPIDHQIEVELPTASASEPMIAEKNSIWIEINQHGHYYYDNRRVQDTDVERILRQQAANNPVGKDVKIRADRRTDFQYVINVINACVNADLPYDFDVRE